MVTFTKSQDSPMGTVLGGPGRSPRAYKALAIITLKTRVEEQRLFYFGATNLGKVTAQTRSPYLCHSCVLKKNENLLQ